MRNVRQGKASGELLVYTVWGVIGIGSLLWAVLVVLAFFDMQKDAAAWVQAVGSIAAILIAVWVPYKQNRDRLDTELDRDNQHLAKILGVARFAAQVSINVSSYLSAGGGDIQVVRKFSASLQGWEDLCRTVNFHEIPDIEVALGWVELISAVQSVQGGLKHYIDGPEFTGRDYYALELAAGRAKAAFERMATGSAATWEDEESKKIS